MAYVQPEEREALRRLREARDRAALELGVITLKWFDQVRATDREILRSEGEQRRVGEAALRAAGYEPDLEDLTIDLESGRILRRDAAGHWAATD
jgi:hypothetical protein